MVSPYFFCRLSSNPWGHRGSAARDPRSTTTRAPGTSQPWSRSAVRSATTEELGWAYGGSRNATSYGADGGRSSAVATVEASTWARVKPSARAFAEISDAVRRSCSTSVTTPAPRDQASRPTAPEPAYRSRNRRPDNDPHHDSTAENRASRTRSLVGRVLAPRGVAIRRPPADPPMIRVMLVLGPQALRSAASVRLACS